METGKFLPTEIATTQANQVRYFSSSLEKKRAIYKDVQYPYPALPEGDVCILEQLAIGTRPEQIKGGESRVAFRLASMRSLGVDFYHSKGDLTGRERALIYNFDEGARTNKDLAEKLITDQNNIRGLRASLRKKFEGKGISYDPDRTFTPMEQQLLDHYEKGIRNVTDLAAALQTSEIYIKFLKGSLTKKGKQIEFPRKPHPFKKRLPVTTDNMPAA